LRGASERRPRAVSSRLPRPPGLDRSVYAQAERDPDGTGRAAQVTAAGTPLRRRVKLGLKYT